MKTWKIKATISVADSWVADGFNLAQRQEEMEELLQSMLPYAYGHEIAVNIQIVSSPDIKQIEQLQNGELEAKD